jgi:hypothetical protein
MDYFGDQLLILMSDLMKSLMPKDVQDTV